MDLGLGLSTLSALNVTGRVLQWVLVVLCILALQWDSSQCALTTAPRIFLVNSADRIVRLVCSALPGLTREFTQTYALATTSVLATRR